MSVFIGPLLAAFSAAGDRVERFDGRVIEPFELLNAQNSVKFLSEFSKSLRKIQEILKSEEFLIFSRKFCEIPRKFDQNRWKNRWNSLKNSDVCGNFSKNPKKFDEILLRFSISSGAKVWQSCRSRKILQNEYSLAKFGVDTEENEPSKVWWFGWKIGVKFGIEPFH